MKLTKSAVLLLIAATGSLFQYCSKAGANATTAANASTETNGTAAGSLPQLPPVVFNYLNPVIPAYIASVLPAVDNTPASNPITNEGATLGRVLFYDKNLSKNNTISCGSCHSPSMSFSDSAVKSKGFLGAATTRHSMALLNVRYYQSGKMFWDERSNTLEEQVLQPIQNAVEMGMSLAELETKVSAQSYYPALFQKAFGSSQVNSDRIAKALAQFVRSIVTYSSKYDLVKQGLASFTAEERDGETLFLTAGNRTCAGCHAPPMFITSNPISGFGLADAQDQGIGNSGRFKSGSLRNIALTAPYFHNGSVPTLQAMLGSAIPAHGVPPQDRAKLLAFMQTLTDQACLTEEKFANPFK
jgi:cytochrome c peroxidase